MERPQKSKRPFLPQGGGVYIYEECTVIFQGCNIYDNMADQVSAHAFRAMAPMELTVPCRVRRT